MLKDRQEILAVGELAVFLLAWTLCVFAALGHHHAGVNPGAERALAESPGGSESLDAVE